MLNKKKYSYHRGKIENDPFNIIIFLTNDPRYAGKFRYNLFTNSREYNGEIITDSVIRHIANDVREELGFYSPSKVKCALSKIFSDETIQYHPVKDFLNSLTWDGKKRLETMNINWLNAEDTPLTRAESRTWMEAAVKRIMEPGCLFEYCLLFTGVPKSVLYTFFQKLSAGFGLATNVSIKSRKRQASELNKNWICLMNELKGHDYDQQRLTRSLIRTRKDLVGKYYIERGRHCVFTGSTSNEEFLKDCSIKPDTKYWIINCGHIDKDYICNNFDDETVKQLWAEAYYMYKNNPDIHPDVEEVESLLINKNNNK